MNPLTNVKNIQKLNEIELKQGLSGTSSSWHAQYKDSAWIFVGGLPYDLTEGDIICVFSQYGEIVNMNLVRDKATGKSKGFCFICFQDQRSTILTVDNINGIKILGRTLRVDHVEEYKTPKDHENDTETARKVRYEGVAPTVKSSTEEEVEEVIDVPVKKKKKEKKKKKKKEKKSKKSSKDKSSSESESSEANDSAVVHSNKHDSHNRKRKSQKSVSPEVKVKTEKIDPAYNKYTNEKRYSDRHDRSVERKGNESYRKNEHQRESYRGDNKREYEDSYRKREKSEDSRKRDSNDRSKETDRRREKYDDRREDRYRDDERDRYGHDRGDRSRDDRDRRRESDRKSSNGYQRDRH